MTLEFTGTKKPGDKTLYVGFICSKEIVKNFDDTWVPEYQRERINIKTKINSLKTIFKEHQKIDSIKLNLVGTIEGTGNNKTLRGKIHTIDGQQRLYALKESEVLDYYVPVELYVDLSIDEEAQLYDQFNGKGTKLTFTDFALSYQSPLGNLFREVANHSRFAIPVVKTGGGGVRISTIVQFVYWINRKINQGEITLSLRTKSGELRNFVLNSEFETQTEIEMLKFSIRNLLDAYVQRWGAYDPKAIPYGGAFFSAWNHLVVMNFLDRFGKVDYKKFSGRVNSSEITDLTLNSRIKSLAGKVERSSIEELQDIILDKMNFKRREGRKLLSLRELRQKTSGNVDAVPTLVAHSDLAEEELF